MTTSQSIILILIIAVGAIVVLCCATLWAEPQDYDPEPPPAPKRGPLDIDTEFL